MTLTLPVDAFVGGEAHSDERELRRS